MLKRVTILMAAVIIALAGVSQTYAAMEFHADFARDGVYENSWPMIAGEVVTVDIYVSNVPAPGLLTIGFKLAYDASIFEVEYANLDFDNWPSEQEDPSNPTGIFVIVNNEIGELEIFGFRLAGLSGDNIRLGRVIFRCKETGSSALTLSPREIPYSGFVLECDNTRQNCDLLEEEHPDEELLQQLLGELDLDDDLGAGVVLATLLPPVMGDVNGDQNVDLADAIAALQGMVQIDGGAYLHSNADISGDNAIGLPEIVYALRGVADLLP